MKYKHTCDGFRPYITDDSKTFEAGAHFARILARRYFGRHAIVQEMRLSRPCYYWHTFWEAIVTNASCTREKYVEFDVRTRVI